MTATQSMTSELSNIMAHVKKVGSVIGEIAAASEQQNEGIGHINKAVDRMNLVTQQLASSSEESAAAAEELSSQAMELRNLVASFRLAKARDERVATSFDDITSSIDLHGARANRMRAGSSQVTADASLPVVNN